MSEPLAVREAPASYQVVPDTQRVRPGYKQTEVGVIPEAWVVRPLGEVVTFLDGKRRPVKDTDRAKMRGTIPYYGASGIVDYVNDYLFDEDLILLGEDGENILSRNCRLAFRISGKAWVNNHAHVLKPNLDISIGFLTDYLESLNYERLNSGTAQPKLNKQSCFGIQVALPPTKAEQEAIAEALSDADALIEALQQLIAKKRHLKQGTMQELLGGKKRLPGFSGEWEVKRLDAVADIRSGGTPSTNQPEFWDGDILWCTPTDITALSGFKYLTQTARTITTHGLKASSAELIPAHSVVMTSRATIGECAINALPVATNQGFKNFIPFDTMDGEFLYYLLQTKKQDFISLCGGSTFLEIGKTQLTAFEIELPKEKSEQTAIATTLSDMDTEIAALETRLAKTRELKQGMMHNLLTGRIRLI